MDIKKLGDQLVELTLKETTELIECMKEEFGIIISIKPDDKPNWKEIESIISELEINRHVNFTTKEILHIVKSYM